ncbi:hypothetical protein BKA56DRAFT_736531, partial [Ilyonectria sp. MPI-CAGE-AT-0026]
LRRSVRTGRSWQPLYRPPFAPAPLPLYHFFCLTLPSIPTLLLFSVLEIHYILSKDACLACSRDLYRTRCAGKVLRRVIWPRHLNRPLEAWKIPVHHPSSAHRC